MSGVISNSNINGGITGLSLDVSALTFAQLKALLPGTEGWRLPTVKALRESNMRVLAIVETRDGVLTVFCNGFFMYETKNGHATVYAVDRCASIVLNPMTDGESGVLDETSFGDCPWPKVLEFAANERITNNISRNMERHEVLSIDVDPEYWDAQMSSQPDFEARLEDETEEAWEAQLLKKAKDVLTVRQWEVFWLYHVKGLTQEEIAARLGIERSPVRKHLAAAQKKLKAILNDVGRNTES